MSHRRDDQTPGSGESAEKSQDWIVLVKGGIVQQAFPSKLAVVEEHHADAPPVTGMYLVRADLPHPPVPGTAVDPMALQWVEVREADGG